MKNLMSRDEYLQSVNEGFIKDRLKKGWEKLKSLFQIGMKKIKGFIAIFNSNGEVLPVVSTQAVIDKFSNSEAVHVYAPKPISDLAVEAGGSGCKSKAEEKTDDDYTTDEPQDESYFEWLDDEANDTVEARNFALLGSAIEEQRKYSGQRLDESWEEMKNSRIKYTDTEALSQADEIDTDEFKEILNQMIFDRIIDGGQDEITDEGEVIESYRNLLIFGAPGIGKSTIPNQIIREYNKRVNNDPARAISLISVNCALIQEGDFMMPTMPKETDVIREIETFADTFPQRKEQLDSMSKHEKDVFAQVISSSGQFKSSDAPKSWLPSYKTTGNDELDKILDDYANSGVYTTPDKKNIRTGSGGIILFDEFLRANEKVFPQLMNFFLERRLQDWTLGSKWVVIACSNRPADDGQIEKVWRHWQDSPAERDRQERMLLLKPDPEQWKKWALNRGFDPILIKFIFDEMDGDEYPRWHTIIRKGVGGAAQIAPITPRRWCSAMNMLQKTKKRYREMEGKKIKDISELPMAAIRASLKGVFDKDFLHELYAWLNDHMMDVNLDEIMENPLETYLPQTYVNDPRAHATFLKNLLAAVEDKFGKTPEDMTEEQITNIIIWIGVNYKYDLNIVKKFFEDLGDNVLKWGSDFRLSKYIKAFMTLEAAYPAKDLEETIKKEYEAPTYVDEETGDVLENKDPWPKGSFETVKEIIRTYFPWRINGDEIIAYGDLSQDVEVKGNDDEEDDNFEEFRTTDDETDVKNMKN